MDEQELSLDSVPQPALAVTQLQEGTYSSPKTSNMRNISMKYTKMHIPYTKKMDQLCFFLSSNISLTLQNFGTVNLQCDFSPVSKHWVNTQFTDIVPLIVFIYIFSFKKC